MKGIFPLGKFNPTLIIICEMCCLDSISQADLSKLKHNSELITDRFKTIAKNARFDSEMQGVV